MTKIEMLIQKRLALIQLADNYRQEIEEDIRSLETPISLVDRVWGFFLFVKENPVIVVSVMSLISSKFRRLSALMTSGKALFGWFKKTKS